VPLEQQAIGGRIAPTHDRVVLRVEDVAGPGFGRSFDRIHTAVATQRERTVTVVLNGVIRHDLVLRGGLPGQAQIVVVVVEFRVGDTVQIGRGEESPLNVFVVTRRIGL